MRHVRFLFLGGGRQRWWVRLLGAALLGGPLWPVTAAAQVTVPPLAPASAPLVFRGVTVIDVREGRRLPNQTVVVVERRIQTVAPVNQVRVPRGARVVEARGKYLIPGLWDMHVHMSKYADVVFPLSLAYGVTGLREAGSDVPLATLRQLKQAIAAGTRVGPRLLVSGPSINGPNPQSPTTIVSSPQSHFVNVPAALAGRFVDSLKAAGADMLKLYGVGGEAQMALIAAAKRAGLLLGGHMPESRGLESSDSGVTFLDHGAYIDNIYKRTCDTSCLAAAAQRFRRNNTWIVSTLVLARYPRNASTKRFRPDEVSGTVYSPAPPDTVPVPTSTAEWLRTLGHSGPSAKSEWVQAGMPIVAGTDTDYLVYGIGTPGYSLNAGLTSFTAMDGMTPLEALQTATLNPARALRATDSLGTVEIGKVADLVLLDRDPLSDSWHTMAIRAVVANGRYYDRAALDRLLVDAERAARR